jgi:hypothetical protein
MNEDSKGWPGNGRARRPASRKRLDDLGGALSETRQP